MSQEMISMTHHEIDRLHLVRQCIEKRTTQRYAAKTLGLSKQHMKRLIERYIGLSAILVKFSLRGQRPQINQPRVKAAHSAIATLGRR